MKVLVMKNEILITGPSLKQKTNKPEMLIIFFHGWGSNGDDLIQLAPLFAQHFPSAFFLSPNAPDACPQNPNGGRQWFSLDFNNDGSIDRSSMPKKVSITSEKVKIFIKYWQNELSVSDDKIFLIGFSQGSMLTLEIGTKNLLGGLLCYSGSFINNNIPLTKKHKILLIHGELDEVIPIQSMLDAKASLEDLGAKVGSHSCDNLGHSINEDGINKGVEFIKQCNIS
jgi:phospholipase/carboxylesterase|tara:strand:- start:399 stop:1076 length:678 start_codon:yes stop_codon:yes gene_type:complete